MPLVFCEVVENQACSLRKHQLTGLNLILGRKVPPFCTTN